MRRARGFTLMEILIAMALTTIVTASVLAIVRTQLQAFEMQDQIVRTQQNTRAGMDFVENIVRRACGGIANGWLYVYTPNLVDTTGTFPCLRVWDGAAVSGNTFSSSSPTTLPDALEVVYATGTMTAVSDATNFYTTTPQLGVLDTCGFSAGDYVIVEDTNFSKASLFHVSAVPSGSTCPRPGTLSLDTVGTAPDAARVPVTACTITNTATGACSTQGSPVFKAATYSFYVGNNLTGSDNVYNNMLLVDPDGVASVTHQDYTKVQPAVEGVVDFQIAVGNDLDGSGTITDTPDEWVGNQVGELPLAIPPWNSGTLTVMPQYRQVRISLVLRTLNTYSGSPPTVTASEDRTTYPPYVVGNDVPRYRQVRMIVAPRAWNLTE